MTTQNIKQFNYSQTMQEKVFIVNIQGNVYAFILECVCVWTAQKSQRAWPAGI